MHISIASTRIPKVNGVKRAVEKICSRYGIAFSTVLFESLDVRSIVSETPTSIEELMKGAKHRAESVFRHSADKTSLSIGVEGGLFSIDTAVFLQSWTCVYDGTAFHYGSSGAVELPEALAHQVISRQVELGIAIDTFAQQHDVRSKQGTYGILTNDLFTREDSFEEATLLALTPLFNTVIFSESHNN